MLLGGSSPTKPFRPSEFDLQGFHSLRPTPRLPRRHSTSNCHSAYGSWRILRLSEQAMEEGYRPSAEFEADALQPLIDLNLTGSKELWLIQCPINQFPEIDGMDLKVKLHEDGMLGGFEDSSGKEFDLISFASQEVGATVILPSGTESKIVGKISRRVSLVRYPEPSELIETMNSKTHQKLTGALTNSSNQFSTPMQSSRLRSAQSALRHSALTHSSRHRSTLSGFADKTKASKRKHSESIGKSDLSGSSGKPHSSTTAVSGSSDRSRESKKKMKIQE